MKEGFEKAGAGVVCSVETSLQTVAERHEFVNPGNDAILLSEGWNGDSYPIHFFLWKATTPCAGLLAEDERLEVR